VFTFGGHYLFEVFQGIILDTEAAGILIVKES